MRLVARPSVALVSAALATTTVACATGGALTGTTGSGHSAGGSATTRASSQGVADSASASASTAGGGGSSSAASSSTTSASGATSSSSTGGAGGAAGDAGADGPPACSQPSDCPVIADACNVATCSNGICQQAPANDGATCLPPDNACSTMGVCATGTCIGAMPIDCTQLSTECATGSCDPMKGCQTTPAMDGTLCHILGKTECLSPECRAGVCTLVPTNEGGSCDDGLFCTANDTCQSGSCTGGPNPCAPADGCYTGTCVEAAKYCSFVPAHDGAPCNDGDVCNPGKTCQAGSCVGGTPGNDGMTCSTGFACETGTTCKSGVCGGGTGPTVYFAESFDTNAKGWTLDPEWAIGATQTCFCETFGGPDPAKDHTGNGTNGVAGVVLGGCEQNTTTHPAYYLTSPPFDTSRATGSIIFGYYRWLNSDGSFYMHNTVDVFNGSWTNIWSSDNEPNAVEDASWVYASFDVTAYKSASMRVRFGYSITFPDTLRLSSWNVDDVLVASAACP